MGDSFRFRNNLFVVKSRLLQAIGKTFHRQKCLKVGIRYYSFERVGFGYSFMYVKDGLVIILKVKVIVLAVAVLILIAKRTVCSPSNS